MDRIKGELSESPGAPAYDPNADRSERLLSNRLFPGFPDCLIPEERLGRGPVAQGLMGPQVILEPEVGSQFPSGLDGVEVGFEVDLLVLHRPPQPLHEDVVLIPSLPVHADLHPMLLQHFG